MGIVECTFNSYSISAHVRSGTGKSYDILGYLQKSNCPNGTFKIDTSVGGTNNYYKLVNPESYGVNTGGKTGYVWISSTYLTKPDPSSLSSSSSQGNNSSSTSTSNTTSTTVIGPPEKEPISAAASVEEIKQAASSGKSNGLDKIYSAGLQSSYALRDIQGMSRIIGMPYVFTAETDYRPFTDQGVNLGRKFLENIINEAPIVSMVPGIPSYLPDMSEEDKTAFSSYISDATSGKLTSDDAKNSVLSQDVRYFAFKADYAKYIRYVNMLLRQSAIYMGIGDKTVPGTSSTYSSYDWGKWTNTNYESSSSGKYGVFDSLADNSKDSESFLTNLLESVDNIASELYDDFKYVRCFVDPNASFSEDNSNNTAASKIAGLFDTVESLAKEINFLAEDNTVLETLKGGITSLSTSTADTVTSLDGEAGASSNIGKLISSATHILDGSNVIFPDMWSDSTYNKSYSFSLNLISPYGDNESIFLNIIVPMMFMIAISTPRQTSANTYGAPFLVKAFAKGWFSCEMGIVDNIRIEKGGDGGAWNIHGLPTEVKISMSIRDLYSNLMITSSSQPALFFQNQGLIEFLAVTCGMDISTTNFMTKVTSIVSSYLESVKDIPSNIMDSFMQMVRNKTEGLWKIGGF